MYEDANLGISRLRRSGHSCRLHRTQLFHRIYGAGGMPGQWLEHTLLVMDIKIRWHPGFVLRVVTASSRN